MLEIVLGIVAGIVSGSGLGGGTILILILVNFMGVEQYQAQALNLLFFIPTSLMAIVMNHKQKLIDYKLGLSIAITGSIGAFIGAKIASQIGVQHLKKYFGIFLLGISAYEGYRIFQQYKKEKNTNNTTE